ncbi:hypothetical protein [Bradyrhizobium sp. Tv2a-2]|uniref:hypothetical protein n=1 Tax=Bradyrhizobium sp. Tv2a-2 TaxID=113395 RepID=UPI000408BBA0|nr:hypothetical protein [Bradyrhizobium sp. Tv2a-2]
MKIQVRRLVVALAIAGPLASATTAKSFAAPINGMSIKAAVPAATTDVRYRVRRDYPDGGYPIYYSYGVYPSYNSYWGYPAYNSYWSHPTYYYSYPGYAYGW